MKFHQRAYAFYLTITFTQVALAAGGAGVVADPGAMQGKHFDLKGKTPSSFTVELQKGLYLYLV